MFHLDCYFNVLILMGPSCRNPWAHFQFYINVELIIMEAYNFRVGATLAVISSSVVISQIRMELLKSFCRVVDAMG